jgi:hypothetical protein
MSKVSKHVSLYVTKFDYLLTTSSQSVLNMGYKHDVRNEDILLYYFDLQHICSKYGLETRLAPSDEIRVVALKTQSMQMFSKHDLLQVMKALFVRTTCNLTVLNMGSKPDLLQLNELVFLHSTYSLSVRNKPWKNDSLQVMKFVY